MADVHREAGANPEYVLGQLARAMTTAGGADPEARTRAEKKMGRWIEVYTGMLFGTLSVGSRTPVSEVPAWATLEVMKGGFATGRLLAGGEFLPHEEERLEALSLPLEKGRLALNGSYMCEAGFEELRSLLESGRYRVELPEEGALLTMAWLFGEGRAEEAHALLDEIAPFFGRLRFYPIPHDRPYAATPVVHVESVRETMDRLASVPAPERILAERESIGVWLPIRDRLVTLFLETMEDGWPCQRYPEGWKERGLALLAEIRTAKEEHRRCGRGRSPRSNITLLSAALACAIDDPAGLTGRKVGTLRAIITSLVTHRDEPGSDRHRARREAQAAQTARPLHRELVPALHARLAAYPMDEGIPDLAALGSPVEAEESSLPAGTEIPAALRRRLRRALQAPVDVLVARGIITSSESLARVLPQITAQVRAAGIGEPILRRLYAGIYAAFRRRRSLLLLNLEKQVQMEELPWVAALECCRADGMAEREASRQTLTELVRLALTAFPQTILPNKLLQEVSALARGANLAIPIVEEIAADIFMGKFSPKYTLAAKRAAGMLAGSVYERYYGLPYRRIRTLTKHDRSDFYRLCCELAGEKADAWSWSWSVSKSGKILEQEQILTSHNLATLFAELDLERELESELPELARRTFAWIVARLQLPIREWQPRLRNIKNAAYAWRQMLFFLALLPASAQADFHAWAKEEGLADAAGSLRDRIQPALVGLLRAIEDDGPIDADGARRFLGWSTTRHWLMEE